MSAQPIIMPTVYPHIVEVWEPLETKAPNPGKAQPYCCYVNTVIFYLKPYIVRPWHHFWNCNGKRLAEKPGQMFEEWDRVETRLRHEDVVTFEGQRFRIYNGRVRWKDNQWWMLREARRIQP